LVLFSLYTSQTPSISPYQNLIIILIIVTVIIIVIMTIFISIAVDVGVLFHVNSTTAGKLHAFVACSSTSST
jgi:hypothetical protein